MNQYTKREHESAVFIAQDALAFAGTYDDDKKAAAVGIILTALELLTPGMTSEQRRELFLREDQ
jgi:hypothetical protein